MSLTIGTHPNNLATWILSNVPELQYGLAEAAGGLDFIRYVDGRETAPLLRAGSIQVGATGSTPPIVAQSAGDTIVYLGRSREHPEHGGVIVPAGSPIRQLGDLKGRSIAFTVGSWQTHAFSEILDRSGAAPAEIKVIDIPAVATAADVLASGADAWLIHDPLLAAVEEKTPGTRIVATVAELVPNRSVFWGDRRYASENPGVISALVKALDDTERWAAANPDAAADLLTGSGRSDSAEKWRNALAHRPWGVGAVDEAFLDEQQRAADLFFRYGVVNSAVRVRDAVIAH
ncbi:ABC transporter substrate-binding protein [Rhizobium puerariae]|uniref:ABC transporter substrate-binding protein n=1 Tax=Rhizobium puerariae TaxID=1585791 RepID=A0ABV6ACN8_9HYPH